ncbi:MAG TPA: flagellar biosynthesis protein FlhF [Pseudogracilibacillus sp.]|nr:flagellar biosynthesis protein FlhF [Pseudogracilibacillus sp.]
MKIKKFVAKSMPEAMKQIKNELGEDAIILNSKEIKSPGIFGLFRRKQIEVMAMLDDSLQTATKPKTTLKNQHPLPDRKIDRPVQKATNTNTKEAEILEEIKYLQSILAKQSRQSEATFPPLLQHVYNYLRNQEVEPSIAGSIVERLEEETEQQDLDRKLIKDLLREEIEARLSSLPFMKVHEDTKVLQFVGPTGVGKTTTIAKVAAKTMLQQDKSVAFITADTYRIAAIEQLKTYATILNVPLEVVYSKEDYKKALQKFATYDLIFVDTAGRNYRENQYINELKEFITIPEEQTDTFLVLALTAKTTDIIDIYEQFKQLDIHRVIFTKLDETDSYGSLLNLPLQERIDIAYLTNGQNVPDDLVEPNEKVITDFLLRGYDND